MNTTRNCPRQIIKRPIVITKDGWCLSPLYDVNPVPAGDELALCVTEDDPTISIELAIRVAPYFGIGKKDADAMANNILLSIRDNWRKLAEKYGLSRSAIEYMRPAFHVCEN